MTPLMLCSHSTLLCILEDATVSVICHPSRFVLVSCYIGTYFLKHRVHIL